MAESEIGNFEAARESRRQRILRRQKALENERSTWDAHWEELGNYILPRRVRMTGSQRNNGSKRNDKINDSTATFCARTLAAGMLTGLTSPARPWFRLATPDQDLMDSEDVRSWLFQVEERMRFVFQKSNLYDALPNVYLDLGVYGTSAMFIEEDHQDIIRCTVLPIGSYYLMTDRSQRIDGLYRRFGMTVRQMREQFGDAALSLQVQNKIKEGRLDEWVDIVHAIERRSDFPELPKYRPNRLKPWSSTYIEYAEPQDQKGEEKFLRISGFDEFPLACPRWSVCGEDIYGSSPAMDILPDIKQLQFMTLMMAEAVEKSIRPPLMAPSTLKGEAISLLPRALNWVPPSQMGRPIEPLFMPTTNLGDLQLMMAQLQQRIRSGLYTDLLLMMGLSPRASQMTAREVEERHEEKMLQLGSVLQRVTTDLLRPLIDRTFNIMQRGGLIPDPPQEIAGTELRIDLISILHQALQLIHLAPIDRLVMTVQGLSPMIPSVVDKLNSDEIVDETARLLGANPKLVNDDAELESIRDQRAQAQSAAAGAAMANQSAQAAKTLSETPMEGDTALTTLMNAYSGGAGA